MKRSVPRSSPSPTRGFVVALAVPWVLWLGLLAALLPRIGSGEWLWAPLVFLASGFLQYWAIIGIHEAIHQHFVRRTRWSRPVAVLCAYPIGLDRNYSWVHLEHHRSFTDLSRDPDAPNYGEFPLDLRSWVKRMLLVGSGLAVVVQVLGRQHTGSRQQPASSQRRFAGELPWKVAVHLVLFGTFWALGFWPGYVLFWLAPLMTQAKLLSFLRTFAEHAHPVHIGVLRSFDRPSLFDRWLCYFGFRYHSEHHLWANVPYQDLAERSLLQGMSDPYGNHVVVAFDGGVLAWHWQLVRSLHRGSASPATSSPSGHLREIENERIVYVPVV